MNQGQPAAAEGIAWVDGRYVPLAEAAVPLVDRGFVRSDATYDVCHVWQGRFFRLHDHISRFRDSMRGLNMSLPLSTDDIAGILCECVRRSGLRDAYVQMTCTRGVPPKGSRDPRQCTNRFYAFAQPFVWIASDEQRRDGLRMIVSDVQRIPPESVDPRIKNFHWLDLTMGIFEAYARDATVALLQDGRGNVTEGAGFNVFVVRDGALATPGRGVFEGMTRRSVIELCEALGLPCACRLVPRHELEVADEIFLTSTAGGIMPVTWLDGRAVGDGRVGSVTGRLHDAYWALQHDNRHAVAIDYPVAAGK